jgi:DNA-binding NarL/FixJ family response regulator
VTPQTHTTPPRPFGLPLTENQQHVLQWVAYGLSNAQIGRQMYLTEDTVKSHAARAYAKLGARDRAHAVALAAKQNLIDLEPVTDKWAQWDTGLAREVGL